MDVDCFILYINYMKVDYRDCFVVFKVHLDIVNEVILIYRCKLYIMYKNDYAKKL